MNTLEKIKFLRKTHKLTQEKIANILGTSAPNYSRYESGEWKFTIEHVKKLASYYKVSIAYLLDDEETTNLILITQEDYNKLKEASDVIIKIDKLIKKNE